MIIGNIDSPWVTDSVSDIMQSRILLTPDYVILTVTIALAVKAGDLFRIKTPEDNTGFENLAIPRMPM